MRPGKRCRLVRGATLILLTATVVAALAVPSGAAGPVDAPSTTTTTPEPGSAPAADVEAPPLQPAFGSLDSARAGVGRISVSGWAIDPSSDAAVEVTVTVDGAPAVTLAADQSRPDVAAVYPEAGPNRGFVGTAFPAAGGTRRVCAVASHESARAATIACRSVTVVGDPVGSLDGAKAASNGTIRVSGWALDPDRSGGPVTVHVWTDAGFARAVTADGLRPDVDAAFPGYGPERGFDTEVSVAGGRRRVCAYAVNSGPGTTREIGCRDVTVARTLPFGNVDAAYATPGTRVRVVGWAIDPTRLAGPVEVHLWSDAGLVGVVSAQTPRPDVQAAYPLYESGFGFDAQVRVPQGTTRVCAYAISARDGTGTELRCVAVRQPPRDPIGSLDSVTRRGSHFRVEGWALDGDTAADVEVHVYVNGTIARVTRADKERYDIYGMYPGFGANRGFSTTAPIGAWPATVCAYAINVGTGTLNRELGCRQLPAIVALACPVAGATFRNDWGEPRSGGRTHRGNDLLAPAGTPIVAPNGGRVRWLDHVDEFPATGGDLGGVSLAVTTADGDWWYFAHLSSINPALAVGDYVSAGTVLGWVGQTGNAALTVPHLHIGLFSLDVATNPYFILADVCLR